MNSSNDSHRHLEAILRDLGVADLDIHLYLLLIKKGGQSVSSLSRQLKVERPTVYAAIERLQELSLIPPHKTPYTRRVIAESPRRVLALLEQKRTSLAQQQQGIETVLPDLLAEFSARTPTTAFRVFEGKEQFLTIFEEVLQEAKDEILYFGDAQSFINLEGLQYERAWIKKRIQKNIFFKMLVFETAVTHDFKKDDERERRETRFLPSAHTFTSSFMVYGNKVLLWSPVAVRAIVIEDSTIAPMFVQLFANSWDQR